MLPFLARGEAKTRTRATASRTACTSMPKAPHARAGRSGARGGRAFSLRGAPAGQQRRVGGPVLESSHGMVRCVPGSTWHRSSIGPLQNPDSHATRPNVCCKVAPMFVAKSPPRSSADRPVADPTSRPRIDLEYQPKSPDRPRLQPRVDPVSLPRSTRTGPTRSTSDPSRCVSARRADRTKFCLDSGKEVRRPALGADPGLARSGRTWPKSRNFVRWKARSAALCGIGFAGLPAARPRVASAPPTGGRILLPEMWGGGLQRAPGTVDAIDRLKPLLEARLMEIHEEIKKSIEELRAARRAAPQLRPKGQAMSARLGRLRGQQRPRHALAAVVAYCRVGPGRASRYRSLLAVGQESVWHSQRCTSSVRGLRHTWSGLVL